MVRTLGAQTRNISFLETDFISQMEFTDAWYFANNSANNTDVP
jgi:hypothetical protein